MMPSTISLATLPQELIDNFTQRLPVNDLSRLSRSCKELRRATVKLLFGNIHMVWEADPNYEPRVLYDRNAEISPRLDLLLRAILENPSLSVYITTVSFHALDFQQSSRIFLQPSLPPLSTYPTPHSSLFREALTEHGLPAYDHWLRAIDQNSLHVVLTIFLAVCQDIQSLTLDVAFLRENRFLSTLLTKDLGASDQKRPLRFSKLRSLTLRAQEQPQYRDDLRYWMSLSLSLDQRIFLSFLYAPNLEHVQMSIQRPFKDVDKLTRSDTIPTMGWPSFLPPKLSALRSLRILESTLDPLNTRVLVSRTPNLTALELDFCSLFTDPFNNHALQSALSLVSSTLTSFKLNCGEYGEDERERLNLRDIERQITYCSFKSMAVLKELEVPPAVVFAGINGIYPGLDELLPQSLVKLTLRSIYTVEAHPRWKADYLLQRSEKFLQRQRWRAHTPHLLSYNLKNGYVFGQSQSHRWLDVVEVEALEQMCEVNGVSFELQQEDDINAQRLDNTSQMVYF